MNRSRAKTAIGAVVVTAALVAVMSVAALAGPTRNAALGPGMMGGLGGYGGGGAGPAGTAKPTSAQLTRVGARIDRWLAANGFAKFKVAEVMAFTNNDYVAVHDPKGKPAFELLTDLRTNWVMEEPPSMMWNTKYGMMGSFGSRVGPMMGGSMMGGGWNGWYGSGSGKVATTKRAVAIANRWLARANPGERVAPDAGGSAMGAFPGYYSFDTVRNGKTYGMLSVNASTGAVWYHGWHGRFLAELEV